MSSFCSELAAGFLFCLLLVFILLRPKAVEQKKEEDILIQNQIYSLFVPSKRMMARDVSALLATKTGGRKDISDAAMYDHLDALVEQKRLLRELIPVVTGGHTYNKVEYFLPRS